MEAKEIVELIALATLTLIFFGAIWYYMKIRNNKNNVYGVRMKEYERKCEEYRKRRENMFAENKPQASFHNPIVSQTQVVKNNSVGIQSDNNVKNTVSSSSDDTFTNALLMNALISNFHSTEPSKATEPVETKKEESYSSPSSDTTSYSSSSSSDDNDRTSYTSSYSSYSSSYDSGSDSSSYSSD